MRFGQLLKYLLSDNDIFIDLAACLFFMDQLLAFLIAIILMSIIIPRRGPFLSLVISSVHYGLLAGMSAELRGYVTTGIGRIFSSLAIAVLSGVVTAEYLRKIGAIDRTVAYLLSISKRGLLVLGMAGYIIPLPVMCRSQPDDS